MSADAWRPVATALLGTWPSQVAAWGAEGLAAYVGELEARGLSPDAALAAVRRYDAAADFPPSAAKLASEARIDPTQPTWPEAYRDLKRALYVRQDYFAGPKVKEEVCCAWLAEHSHELLAAFFRAQTYETLSTLPLNDEDEDGTFARKRLREDWDRFVERADARVAHGLPLDAGTARKQLGPHKPDFAAALPAGPEDES